MVEFFQQDNASPRTARRAVHIGNVVFSCKKRDGHGLAGAEHRSQPRMNLWSALDFQISGNGLKHRKNYSML